MVQNITFYRKHYGVFFMDESAEFLKVCLKAIDDRRAHNTVHQLAHILTIALFAMVGGYGTFQDFELFGVAKLEWFRQTFGINRIPSHDTFGRVFGMLDPNKFENALRIWTAHIIGRPTPGKTDIVSLDGKAINGAVDGFLNIVSAWSTAHGMVLGGICTEGSKRNELAAMIKLVGELRLTGSIVTTDAAGTYTEFVDAVLEKGADYVLPVKGNQPNTENAVIAAFENPSAPVFTCSTLDKTGGGE